MTSSLFQPITLGGLTLPNRIAVAPMCQYSAEDGSASDWHLYHWMNLAMSGAGMVTVEMTDVERRGRISHGCLGLYSDDNEAAARRTLDAARRVAAPGTKFGTQLAHAGRKASCQRPWEGGGPLKPDQDPWPIVSASAIAYDTGWQVPHALEEDEILRIIERFADAARRAERAGFDFIELHAAHGYLIFQFLSPLSNRRTDRWGGSLENRMRFVIEIARAVRKAVPRLMLGARLSVKEWVDG
ncbi:MAG: oxidoreductase, partial [Mesorhizobium sp.]